MNHWSAGDFKLASEMVARYKTIRQTVHLSIGGSKVRIRLSNEFGAKRIEDWRFGPRWKCDSGGRASTAAGLI